MMDNAFDAVFGGQGEPESTPTPTFNFETMNQATAFKVLPPGTFNMRIKKYSHKQHTPFKDGVKRVAYDWILEVTDEGENFGVTTRYTTNYGTVDPVTGEVKQDADSIRSLAFFLRAAGLLDDPEFTDASGSFTISDDAMLNRRLTVEIIHKSSVNAETGETRTFANVKKVMTYAPAPGSRWNAEQPF